MIGAGSFVCDQYCVFCVGTAEFAVPAGAVREIADMVPIVGVPLSAGVLKGLCHHRNDFLPVLSLPELLGEKADREADCRLLLVMESADGPWGLPISRAVALEALEMASIGETGGDAPRPLVMGTASFRHDVVRILDADRLYQAAIDRLGEDWTWFGAGLRMSPNERLEVSADMGETVGQSSGSVGRPRHNALGRESEPQRARSGNRGTTRLTPLA